MGAPPTSSHPAAGPRLAWQARVPEARTAPQPAHAAWAGTHRCLQPREAAGAHLGTTCRGTRKHAPTSRCTFQKYPWESGLP
jgi:hypothetical protein